MTDSSKESFQDVEEEYTLSDGNEDAVFVEDMDGC